MEHNQNNQTHPEIKGEKVKLVTKGSQNQNLEEHLRIK